MTYLTREEVIRLPRCRAACLFTKTCQDCPTFLYLVNEKLPLELAHAYHKQMPWNVRPDSGCRSDVAK